jgi:DNA polymerase phi
MSSSGSVALQLFWDLSSADGARRHAAALQLTKALRLAHKTAEAAGELPAAGDDLQKAGALRSDGGALSVEVTYAVRRLVKGLASSREGSREGFALGLCLLLRSFPEIDGERLLVMMIDSLPVKGGGMSDTEIKENNFGRLFGCMALIQTGKCSPSASEWTAAANSGAIDSMLCVKVLDELARLQGCKSFMAEATTHAIGQMMRGALSGAPVDVVANQLLPRLRKGGEELDVREMTPEQLEMHLFAQGLLSPDKAPCLKETRMAELVEPLKKATASHPRLHHVWTQLLGLIAGFQGDKAKAGAAAKWGPESIKVLGIFWTTVVEEALLVSSHERKYAGLLLVQELARDVPPAGLLAVLTPNLRRTIINNVGKKQCLLNSVANKTLEALMGRAAQDAALALDLLELIITQHRNFDKVTHTRTTTRLLELLDAKGKMRYLKLLLNAYWYPHAHRASLAATGHPPPPLAPCRPRIAAVAARAPSVPLPLPLPLPLLLPLRVCQVADVADGPWKGGLD